MVVQKNTNVCGPGFFELCEKLNIHAKCNELLEEVKKCKHWNILADYFKINVVGISSQQDTLLNSIQTEIVEGDLIQINSTRYERDKEIRSECLRIHGTKCKICGFDASKVYGEDFIGKIHVHHITPLSFIKSEHKVDPEIDVIPVCPNCHMIIHSKSEGVYTPEEVKQMIDKTK
jgi:predicted HNH restriction endonuclease